MSEFNKNLYWKVRLIDKINRSFDDTVVLLKDIQETYSVLKKREPTDFKRIIKEIGDSYTELKQMVDTIDDEPLQKE